MDVHPLQLALRNEALTAADKLLTIAEAATSSTYRLFEAAELRCVGICGTRRISSAEIDRSIADHTEAAS
jgi:hypothetical protein